MIQRSGAFNFKCWYKFRTSPNFYTICETNFQSFSIGKVEKIDIIIANFTFLNSETPPHVFHKDWNFYSLIALDIFPTYLEHFVNLSYEYQGYAGTIQNYRFNDAY